MLAIKWACECHAVLTHSHTAQQRGHSHSTSSWSNSLSDTCQRRYSADGEEELSMRAASGATRRSAASSCAMASPKLPCGASQAGM